MKLTHITVLILSLSVIGCVSYRPAIDDGIDPMPPEPEYSNFTRQPIVEKQDHNFIVTDEFVLRATQEHEYLKRIKKWKQEQAIP